MIKNHTKKETLVLEFFFVALFAYMPSARSSDTTVWAAALLMLAIDSLFKVLRQKYFKIDSSIVWYISILFWGFVSCLWSKDTSKDEVYLILYASVIIVGAICIGMHLNSDDDVDYIMKLIIIAGCYAGLRFSYYTPWESILSSGYYMRGTFGSLLDDVTNYNSYTSHLCIITIIAGYYAITKKVKWCRYAFILLFAIVIFGGSRKNLLIIPLITMFFAISTGSISRRVRNVILVCAAIAVAFYALMTFDFLSQIRDTFFEMLSGLSTSQAVDESTIERMYLINMASQVWGKHLLLGVGWDNFRYYNALGLYAHNSYFELLACLGIIGFGLYYSFYVGLIGKTIWNISHIKRNKLDILMLGVVISFLIQEYGAITVYGRERVILLLVVATAYSVSSGAKLKIVTIGNVR